MEAIAAGGAPAGFSPKEVALLAFLRRCGEGCGEAVTEADVAAVRAAGVELDELIEGIEEVNQSSAFNRWAAVLDIGMEDR